MNTHHLSQGQAAKATGKSKTTIHNAIKSGKISASKESGQYQIDPAELFRVYPAIEQSSTEQQGEQVNGQSNPQIERSVTPEMNGLTGEVDALKQVIEQLKDRLDEKDERITEYKTTIQKTENLLSDQRSESEKAKAAKDLAESERARAIHHAKQNRPHKRKLTLRERVFGGEIEVINTKRR